MSQDRIALIIDELPKSPKIHALTTQLHDFYNEVINRLDNDQIESFPSYFIDDCTYQVVSRENYSQNLPQATIYCDGIAMVQDRVTALRQTQVYVPRLWRHFLSGLQITAIVRDDIHVRANFMITEAMSDQDPTVFLVGQYMDVIVRDGDTFKFKQHLAVYDNHHIRRSLIVPV